MRLSYPAKKTFSQTSFFLKDRITDIFENSSSQDETYEKKSKLYFEGWHKKNHHFKKVIKLFMSVPKYEYMVTYLKEADVPRPSNSENSIKLVRLWENSRYGFRTAKGLQGHLKLYQKMKYLGQIYLKQKFSLKLASDKEKSEKVAKNLSKFRFLALIKFLF